MSIGRRCYCATPGWLMIFPPFRSLAAGSQLSNVFGGPSKLASGAASAAFSSEVYERAFTFGLTPIFRHVHFGRDG